MKRIKFSFRFLFVVIIALTGLSGCFLTSSHKDYTYEPINIVMSQMNLTVYTQPINLENSQSGLVVRGNDKGGEYGLSIEFEVNNNISIKNIDIQIFSQDYKFNDFNKNVNKKFNYENVYLYFHLIKYLPYEAHELNLKFDTCDEQNNCSTNFVKKELEPSIVRKNKLIL